MPESDLLMVPAEGPLDAKIVLVGEAPGETEVEKRRPFVGRAGSVLDGLLEEAGIDRNECYITNVMKVRPAGNKFKNFYVKENRKIVPSAELLRSIEELKLTITSISPNVIVALGGEALKALTGLEGITNYRGSVLSSPYGKIIPVLHPASIARNWTSRSATAYDFSKIKKESEFKEVRLTEREVVVAYSVEEVKNEIERLLTKEKVSFDIETESDQITCIGFADSGNRAVVIPFWFGECRFLRSASEDEAVWRLIKELLVSNVGKIAHNGSYDIDVIYRTTGILVNNLVFDTELGMHALYIELSKSLAFATSIYTDQPYYKYMRKTDDMDSYFRYNGLDCCVTYEIACKLEEEIKESGMWEFFEEHMMGLLQPLRRMEWKGVKIDKKGRTKAKWDYRRKIKKLNKEFTELVGHEINVSSPKQMQNWLYEELKYPKQYNKNKEDGTVSLTADEEALEACYKIKPLEALKVALQLREDNKIYGTYLKVQLDPDGRIRCAYNLCGTETGRLSSSKTLRGVGTNLQNIPPGVVKKLFIPDEGKVFINADLSQAEARVVAYLSEEIRLIGVFNNGGDVHRKNAASIYNKPESEVTDDERQLAKRVVHASNYGMGPVTFAKEASIDIPSARRLLNIYFVTFPRIRKWQIDLQHHLKQSRTLITPLGRKRVFFNRWEKSLLKEGLAFVPQGTVADVLNWGLRRLDALWLDKEGWDILLQVHDSILVQVPESCVEQAVREMKECMEIPVAIKGRKLVIPVDFKVGYNWEDMEKYKKERS